MNKHRGQVALIMVLIMTVVSALVVSFAGRATTSTRVQTMLTENNDAFIAARSGIENAIYKNADWSGTVGERNEYSVTRSEGGQSSLVLDSVPSGSSVDISLSGVSGLTGARIYWSGDVASPASLFVSVASTSGVVDYAFDTLGQNGFTKATAVGLLLGERFDFVTPNITFATSPLSMRIIVYGSTIKLGILPLGADFPPQILSYKAIGQVSGSDSNVKYGLEYQESKNSKLPEVFNYALFSYGSIIQ